MRFYLRIDDCSVDVEFDHPPEVAEQLIVRNLQKMAILAARHGLAGMWAAMRRAAERAMRDLNGQRVMPWEEDH